MTRIVRHVKDGRIGVAIGPHAEAIYDAPSTLQCGIALKAPPPVELQRECVCWWVPGRRCWTLPDAVYTVELETLWSRAWKLVKNAQRWSLTSTLRDIEAKLIADKGLRVGSDDNLSTWYAVNRVLGIE